MPLGFCRLVLFSLMSLRTCYLTYKEFCVTFEQPLVVVNIQNKFQPCFVALEKKRLPNTITLTETKKKHDIGFSGAGEDCAALFSPPLSVPHGGAGLLALLPV